jgi:hypothetical protein
MLSVTVSGTQSAAFRRRLGARARNVAERLHQSNRKESQNRFDLYSRYNYHADVVKSHGLSAERPQSKHYETDALDSGERFKHF